MTENGRNIAVGLTVLTGMALLAALILMFTGLPEFFKTGNRVEMQFDHTYEVATGDPLHLRGMQIGLVSDVSFTDGDPTKGVTITAVVDSDVSLPGNVQAKIYTKGLVGRGYLTLVPEGPLAKDAAGKPIQYYPPGQTIKLRGIHDLSNGLLPPELTKAMDNFGKLAKNLNEFLNPTPQAQPGSQPATGPATQPAGLKGTLTRLDRTLDALHAVAGNMENQENIKTTLKNLSESTAELKNFMKKAGKTLDSADELTRKLITDAEEISKLLISFQKTAESINTGKGTAGKLLNDPKLYNNLVEVSIQLEGLVKDFRRLAEKWESKGVGIKLK